MRHTCSVRICGMHMTYTWAAYADMRPTLRTLTTSIYFFFAVVLRLRLLLARTPVRMSSTWYARLRHSLAIIATCLMTGSKFVGPYSFTTWRESAYAFRSPSTPSTSVCVGAPVSAKQCDASAPPGRMAPKPSAPTFLSLS